MRIFLQGVSALAPGGRPRVTITVHPDVTFAAAHADLMRVLKLDQLLAQASQVCAHTHTHTHTLSLSHTPPSGWAGFVLLF